MGVLTFDFPVIDTGTKGESGEIDNIQLSIDITQTSGSNATYTCSDYNVRCDKYGDTVYEFDLDTFIVASGRSNYEIFDPDEFMSKYLMAPSDNTVDDIEADVTFQRNGTDEFLGNIVGDTVSYNHDTKILKFDVRPRVDLIKAAATQNDAGSPLDPLGYGSSGLIQVEQLVEDIFNVAAPGITVNFHNDWKFQDTEDPGTNYYNFNELYLSKSDITNNTYDQTNLLDLLQHICIEFYSMAGLLDNGTIFFKNIFSYGASGTQTILNTKILEYKNRYKLNKLDYITLGSSSVGTYTNVEGTFKNLSAPGWSISSDLVDTSNTYDIANGLNPSQGVVITTINTSTEYITSVAHGITENDPVRLYTTDTMPGGLSADTTYFALNVTADTMQLALTAGGAAINITSGGAGIITIAGFHSLTLELLNSWFDNRSTYQSAMVATFKMHGVWYNFIEDFVYSGKQYQIIKLQKQWEQGTTVIEAVMIGDNE